MPEGRGEGSYNKSLTGHDIIRELQSAIALDETAHKMTKKSRKTILSRFKPGNTIQLDQVFEQAAESWDVWREELGDRILSLANIASYPHPKSLMKSFK